MKIRFTNIKIENFKSIDLLETKFGEKTFVYGANETGKTSFADAISWCLTGKNSLGDSQFNFVPIGKTGVSPSVTLEIDISGKKKDSIDHVVLQRVYQAKQNRHKEFTGEYQTICYVNRLKVGVKEFDKWIEDHICDSEIFRLIHDVRYFTENITVNGRERPWEAQRRLLFSISGIKPDLDFARSKRRFELILDGLQRYDNASQYLNFLKSEEKRIEDEIRYHNARIESTKYMFGDCEEVNEDIEKQIDELKLKVNNLDTEIEQETKKLREERDKKVSEIKRLYNDKAAEFKNKLKEYSEKSNELNLERENIKRAIIDLQCEITSVIFQLKKAKEKYDNIDIQCPTCGQYIPTEMIEEKRSGLEAQIKELQEQVDSLKEQEKEAKKELARVEKEIEALKTPNCIEELKDVERNLTVAETMKTFSEQEKRIAERKKELITLLDSLKEKKYVADRNQKAKEAISDLESKVSELLDMRANNSRLLDLTRDFIDAKCVYAEKKINGLFNDIEFRLFHKNKVNDEVRPVCDVYFHGVPYQSLSCSTKFIVSMNIALAFQRFYKVEMPILVDNAESIDGIETNVQSIMLIKRDEVCPKCGGEVGRKESDGLFSCKSCNNRFKKHLEIITE